MKKIIIIGSGSSGLMAAAMFKRFYAGRIKVEVYYDSKKKNIGVYYKNKKINDETNEYTLREKWFGALSRKGFTLEVIRKVINIKDIDNADLILEDNV